MSHLNLIGGNMTCDDPDSRAKNDSDEHSNGRSMGNWGKDAVGTLDELNFSHIFDYNAIEQIANGLEKMVQSWSTAQEERAHEYSRVSVSSDKDSSQIHAKSEGSLTGSPLQMKEYGSQAFSVGGCSPMNASEALKNLAKVSGFGDSKNPRGPGNLQKAAAQIKDYVATGSSEKNISQAQQKEYVKVGASSVERHTPRPSRPFSRAAGGLQKNAPRIEKENSRAEVSPRRNASQVEKETGRLSPRKSTSQVDKENGRIGFRPTKIASQPENRTEVSPRRSSSQSQKENSRVEVPKRNTSQAYHESSRIGVSSGTNCAHEHAERSLHQVNFRTEGCLDKDNSVEMQKVYVDVASNLERSFSQKECSSTERNTCEEYLRVVTPVTMIIKECMGAQREPSGETILKDSTIAPDGLEKLAPLEQKSYADVGNLESILPKGYVNNVLERECDPVYPENDLLLGIKKDFAGAAASLERDPVGMQMHSSRVAEERTLKQTSVGREYVELQNTSMLIPDMLDTHEEGINTEVIHGDFEGNFSLFSLEDIADLRTDSNVTDAADTARNVTKPEEKNFEQEEVDDSFFTSSSYWCDLPMGRALNEDKYEKQKLHECSYVNDALYEKADFTTSYEERPLKRKKEYFEAFRNSSYEIECESPAALGGVSYVKADCGGPCISETVIFGEDCFNQRGFAAFARNISGPLELEIDDSKEAYKSKVEELQIALLECAAEYEVKLVEMEMKMLQLKSKYQLLDQEPPPSLKSDKEWTTRRLENYRKQNIKLQREKEGHTKEMSEMRKKERQFDLLRKNLEDSLMKVNCLQRCTGRNRELVKKEEELVDSQLKEKEAKAHLYQVEAALQQAEASQIDHGSVLSLLTALSQWLQNIKKASLVKFDPRHQLQIQQYEESLSKLTEEYLPQKSLQKLPQLGFIGYLEGGLTQADKPEQSPPEVKREVQALQNELEKLACRRSTF